MSRARSRQPEDHRSELLRAFRVGDEDIEANRMGALGRRQAQRLVRSGYLNLFMAAALAAAVLVILFAVAERPFKPVQVILAVGLVAALLTLGVVMLLRSSAAAAAGQVDCFAGPVFAHMQGRAGWYLTVADQSFKLPVQYWHVQNEAPYRVYVVPRAKRIVAMEPDGWG
jgi:hypothetical protein